jgi:hypothetical protein
LVNLALDLLAQDPVTSIVNPASPAADIMARWYDQIRRLLLRKYIFNFARKVVLITPNANAPAHPEFVNGYSLPNDSVRLLKLGDRILWGGAIPTDFFDFSGGYLYCDDIAGAVGLATPAPVLTLTAIYRSGDLYAGIAVPAGSTVALVAGGAPIPGAQYQVSGVVGTVQLNGNVYQLVAGLLGANAVYFLQTAGGQNFDSSAYGTYSAGGAAAPIYVPPGASANPTGLELTYTYDAQNVLQFDSAFIDVLAATLAARTCKKITGKEPSDKLIAELRNAEVAAAAISGQEKPPVRVQRSRIRDVRRAGGSWRNNTRIGGR